MDTVTRIVLDHRCANVNRRLEGTGRHVEWQGRSGQIALDEYEGTSCLRLITVGTKRQVADFLHAMMVGIDLSRTQPESQESTPELLDPEGSGYVAEPPWDIV